MSARLTLFAWAMALPALAHAQAHAQAARISEALVFPGGAEVKRVVNVPAGSDEAVFACIPARIELDALQAKGGAGLQVGELRVQTQASAAVPECSGNRQLDDRIAALEDQRALVQAERTALDLVLGYLRASGDPKTPPQAAVAENLRRQAQEVLQQQHRLTRRSQAIDAQLRPLLAEREAARGGVEQWHRISVRVAGSGELTLTTRSPHAGWQPVYRADLDSSAARIAFERRAEVQQTTGESWRGVKLSLSTRQPQRAMALPEPEPWWLRKAEPMRALAEMRAVGIPEVAADMKAAATAVDADLPRFETDFDLQFVVPEPVTLASGAERRSVTLQRQHWAAELVTQVQPQAAATAYLMATVKRPEGFFPPGKLLLARDGSFIGESHFALDDEAEQRLYFGPDDRLRVRVEPEQHEGANGGFIGNRKVLTLTRSYVLENLGSKPLAVQMLEATPVAQHEDIKVQSRFEPAPSTTRWRELDGLTLWRFGLAPKGAQRVRAQYELSAPKDMSVQGWPLGRSVGY